jgi:hypothetical protein
MNFINCTPHALIIDGVGTLKPSGILPRCATERRDSPHVGGVRVVMQVMGAVTGLPDPAEGVALIVSGMVLTALGGARPDVFAPDTGPDAIREGGQIVAVRGLVQ